MKTNDHRGVLEVFDSWPSVMRTSVHVDDAVFSVLSAFTEATVPRGPIVAFKDDVMASTLIRTEVNGAVLKAEIAVLDPDGAVNIGQQCEIQLAADSVAVKARREPVEEARQPPAVKSFAACLVPRVAHTYPFSDYVAKSFLCCGNRTFCRLCSIGRIWARLIWRGTIEFVWVYRYGGGVEWFVEFVWWNRWCGWGGSWALR